MIDDDLNEDAFALVEEEDELEDDGVPEHILDLEEGSELLQVEQKKLRRLAELRVKRDLAKKAAETSDREYREYEEEMYMQLDESPLKGALKIDVGAPYGVLTFNPQSRHYGRILNKKEALDWFTSRNMLEDATEQKLSRARLNEIVNDIIDSGSAQMPPGVDFYTKRFITISGLKD